MAKTKWVSFEGRILFNTELAASRTLKEFIEVQKHHGLSEKQYREIHGACVKLVGKKSSEKPKDDPGHD